MAASIKFNIKGWNKLVGDIIDTEGVKRMSRVAQACNAADDTDEYKVSVEGTNPLNRRNFRATVITAGPRAIRGNAKRNTLVRNFYRAAGS